MIRNRLCHVIITLLFFSVGFNGIAQTIVSEPALPTSEELVTVLFDATDTPLEDYSGDLYTHTGVILNGDSNWSHVIGDWGSNNQPKLESLGNNLYKLIIDPDINTFYSLDDSEKVVKLAFVFRSQDGNIQSEDLFVDVYESGLNVSFLRPELPQLVTADQTIEIEISANDCDSVFFKVDDDILIKEQGLTISTTIQSLASGKHHLIAIAKDIEGNCVYDSTFYVVRDANTIEALPDGVRKGINYIDDETVTLVLYAPYKNFVYLIGDFNDWQYDNDYLMKKDPDGNHFWLTISGLIPGKEYVFQYLIDGELKIADPYTDKVSDPNMDKYISESVYPGLIAYPEGKTEGNAAVLQTAQQAYPWEIDDFETPNKKDLVIYELLVRDFTANGDYKTVADTLDYLQKMGVNAIELMPVNEFEGNSSWGYNPSFYFAPDKAYGPKNELKRLVDEAHKRGMAVLGDLVLNHSFSQSPFAQMYMENGHPSGLNPWYNQHSNFTNPDAQWGYDFNHESVQTRALVDSINSYWMSEYHLDGFRFDFTKGFSNNIKDSSDPWGSKYDADRIYNLKRMADEIWARKSDALVIFEHLAENAEEKELADYGIMLWGNMNYNYLEAAMGWNANSDLSWASYKARNWNEPNLITYFESHDEERLMFKTLEYGNQNNPSYDVQALTTALKRAELDAVFLFAIPGPKMIWQFGELGYDVSIDFDGRTSPKPIKWNYFNDWRRNYLYQLYGALADLKISQDAFETSDYNMDVSGALKRVNLNGESMDVVILGNFDVNAGEIDPHFQQTGQWYDYFAGTSIDVSDVNDKITLAPGEYRIYTSVQLQKPNINTTIPEHSNIQDGNIIVYPNPSSSCVNINIDVKIDSNVNAEVYNAFGQKVTSLFNDEVKASNVALKWNVENDVALGVYFVVISINDHKNVRKVMVQ